VEGAHLTEEGAKLHPPAIQMARFAGELHQIATDFDDRPAGMVRIAVPPGTAFDFMVPFARGLKKSLPEIQVHAITGIEQLDLSRGHAELALRNRAPTQPDLMVVAHAQIELGVFASETYARQAQDKFCPGDHQLELKHLDWVGWSYPNEHLEPTPTLKKLLPDFSPAFASNDYIVQMRAAEEGLGAMILPKLSHKDQAFSSLIELDVGLKLPAADMYLVCAKTMRWVPRVRAVASELVSALASIPGLKVLEQ